MPGRVSRRKLAEFTAKQLLAEKADALHNLAAFLIDTGRTREAELIVRDIEDALARQGTVVARVASARPLSDELTSSIRTFISDNYNGATAVLDTSVRPELLGGVRITTPDAELDSTIQRRLTVLRAKKV